MNQRGGNDRREHDPRPPEDVELLGAVLDSLDDGIVTCDEHGVVTFVNDVARRFHGLSPEEPVGSWIHRDDLYHPEQRAPLSPEDNPLARALAGETVRHSALVIAPRSGRACSVQANGTALFGRDGRKVGAVVVLRDRTEHRHADEELGQAFVDQLTGLGNRASLAGQMEAVRRRASPGGSRLAVLVIDLDDFKKVNDSLGHATGDAVLVDTASRLRRCLRPSDRVVRLGDDEFAAVLARGSDEEVIMVADEILAATADPFDLQGSEVIVGSSIGIALGDDDHDDPEKMLRAADLAMYVAKSRGKGGYALFEPDMHVVALGRLALEADLRRALAERQFTLAYQPVVRLGDGEIAGVEALLRWHPRGQPPARPDDFIPVAEESGLIVPIGAWVLEEACAQLRRWDAQHPDRPPLTVAVNVAGRQLQRSGLVDTVVEVLERTGLEPRRLVLEITESTLAADDEGALATLWEIKRLGVSLSIDDFGTGFSSLGRLRTLPVAAVKIDRSFVAEIEAADASAPIVVATLAMARGLGLSVVAEGIETAEQLRFLRRHGCPEAQGFLLSRPVGAAEIGALLAAGEPLADVYKSRTNDGAPAADEHLTAVIEEAVTGHKGDEETIRSLLAQAARLTGLESTYLTEIHWERFEQEVRYSLNTGDLEIGEGLVVDWADTLCRRALLGGPSCTDDVPGDYPDSEAARALGLQTYVSVPVPAPDGRVFGTLCGASSTRCRLGETQMAVLHLFSRLIADALLRHG